MRNGRDEIVKCKMRIENVLKMQYMDVPCTARGGCAAVQAVLYIYICATDIGWDGAGEV